MKKLQITVSDDLAERIEAVCTRYGTTVSPFCAILLGIGMDGIGFCKSGFGGGFNHEKETEN